MVVMSSVLRSSISTGVDVVSGTLSCCKMLSYAAFALFKRRIISRICGASVHPLHCFRRALLFDRREFLPAGSRASQILLSRIAM